MIRHRQWHSRQDEPGRQLWHAVFSRIHDHFHRHHHDRFYRYHSYFRYVRPGFVIFNLLILYLLFSWAGIKGVGIFFAVLLSIKEIIQFFFLLSLEKRIFKPIEQLRRGVDEIAKGNYNINIECTTPNDLGLLIASFNEMAHKLSESEKIKAVYEENRKTLLVNISHDLKTPITAIQGYIEAVLDETVTTTEHRRKYLQTIYRNTMYINKLIDDLFLFSKLDMQKLDFQYEQVNIGSFMDDLMQEYKFDLEERKIQFRYTAQLSHDCAVSLDRKRFRQALDNIINNAVKHGKESYLSIQVAMHRQGDCICIDIRDNGRGIPPDKLPFIFDRFYRIDPERTKDLTSTGLGLAITKELIKAHGGDITVTSEENKGTCFSILLPILPNDDGEG